MAYRVPEEFVEDLFTAMMDKFIEKLDEPGVDASDEDENFIPMTRLEKMNLHCPDDPAGMEMDPPKDNASGRKRGAVARGLATPCGVFTSGSQRQETDGES